MKLCCAFLLLFCFVNKVYLLNNGLALRPPMGWMSWGYYMCADKCDETPEKCLNENLILSVADTFFTEGYQEAGYEYIIIDDCWSEKERDSRGRLVPNKERFPNGMKYIADYIHARGLKFGMYTNIADITCMGYPGSKYHFSTDAKTFAEWEIDYLKVDGCYVNEAYLDVAYIQLGKELNKTGRPIVYSCSWPFYKEFVVHHEPNLTAVSKYCNLWRNYHDVHLNWESLKFIADFFKASYSKLSVHHGPSGWNDPDMLILGTNTLNDGQTRAHLGVYVMLSAPLLLSCDMKHITKYEKELLLNMDLLAVAQDPMGIMARPYTKGQLTLWVKPHMPKKGDKYPAFSFLLVNVESTSASISFIPGQYGLNSTDGYSVYIVFQGIYWNNITLTDSISTTVPPDDAIMYTLYPL